MMLLPRIQQLLMVSLGVSLLVLPVFGGKPDKRAPEPAAKICTVTGDIVSGGSEGGLVEIGGNTRGASWGLLDPYDDCASATLYLHENLLKDDEGGQYSCTALGYLLTEGSYFGQVHWCDDGGLGFDFGPEPCVAWPAGNEPPFALPGTPNAQICPFSLYVSGGELVDTDTWLLDANASVWLADWTQGPPCETDPVPGCVPNPSGGFSGYGVGSGPITEGIVVQFYPDEEKDCGAAAAEGNRKKCSDGRDNDLDGFIDCADADCNPWCK